VPAGADQPTQPGTFFLGENDTIPVHHGGAHCDARHCRTIRRTAIATGYSRMTHHELWRKGTMKVAYVFTTSGHTASYKLGKMILPQLERGNHGAEVVGMMFFDDNTYLLRKGDPLGERLAKVATEQGILLMLCDQCALERGLAEGEFGTVPSACKAVGTVENVQVGCFPDLYSALAGNPPDQVISL
jgi:hypothetical protein